MKTLVFAEKPSVGKDIARILNASRRGDGFLEGDKYIVTWGFGHLVALAHPEIQNPDWKFWRLDSLPMVPKQWKLSVIPSAKEQYEKVAALFHRDDVEMIINAADAGREGELIFRLVYSNCGCTKPFKRLWISSMTDEAITKGFEDIRPGEQYDNLGEAALCRSRADWLVGMNFTRAYTKKLNTMYTVGRVQTPTLAMVVSRHLEILNFVPKDYWEVSAIFSDFSAKWFDPKETEFPSRIDDRKKAEELAERIKGSIGTVKSVKKTAKKQVPPFLYDLTALQRDANTKYSMTAADTLSVLQGLYEKKKAVTYPRTDSRYLSEDIYPTIGRRLAAIPEIYDEDLEYLRHNKPKKEKRVFNNSKVSDHHALIPTEKKVTNNEFSRWTREERNIYDLIVRRFLAVFYPDHKYLSTVVTLDIKGESFKTGGKVVTEEGWRALYQKKNEAESEKSMDKPEEDEENESDLPDLKKGDTREVLDAKSDTKKTKPPSAYTEATLLQAMETAGKFVDNEELRDAMKDGGLGTPATRAEIIEKLIKVEYMTRNKKKLEPTPKGIKLIRLAEKDIKSPELTGSWEKRLADISKGTDKADTFMSDITSFVLQVVKDIKASKELMLAAEKRVYNKKFPAKNNRAANGQAEKSKGNTVKMAPPVSNRVLAVCPACGKGGIIEGTRGYGCNRFREGCSFVVWKEFMGKKLTPVAIKTLIEGKTTRVLKGFKLEDGTVVSGRIAMKKDKSGIELIISEEDSGKN